MSLSDSFVQVRSSVATQFRVVHALIVRDVAEDFGKSPVDFGYLLARPAMDIATLYVVYLLIHRTTPQGMSLMAFLVTGWLGWFIFIRAVQQMQSYGRGSNRLLLFPQITILDMYIAKTMTVQVVYTVVLFMFLAAVFLFERSPLPADPLHVLFGYWSLGAMGALLALNLESVVRVVPIADYLNEPIRRLGALATGAVVAAADLPQSVLKYISWNPVLNAIELMREAWWPAYISPAADQGLVVKWMFFMLASGLILERATRGFIEE